MALLRSSVRFRYAPTTSPGRCPGLLQLQPFGLMKHLLFAILGRRHPGRCPGLLQLQPFGLMKHLLFAILGRRHPGRCPGLLQLQPFGLMKHLLFAILGPKAPRALPWAVAAPALRADETSFICNLRPEGTQGVALGCCSSSPSG